MKSTIFTLFSALILTQGVNVHAEGIFAKTFRSKLNQPASADIQFATLENNSDPTEANSQNMAASADANILQASYCETGCAANPCDSACGSWFGDKMAPGTGAFGGDSRFAASLSFNQDVFFGNYTFAAAGYALNNAVDVTFYSILWHTDFFSQGLVGGIDGTGLWTEFGGGLNFKLMDGALNINPQFGILNGALLSAFGPPKVFDGVVPNITATYDDTIIESEFYMGYYIGARSAPVGSFNNDYLHWWYNAGIRPWGDSNDWKSIVSTGLHYEMLRQTAPGTAQNLYSWIGPYFQVALPNGFNMRYSAGWNVDDNVGLGDNFYKVNIGFDF